MRVRSVGNGNNVCIDGTCAGQATHIVAVCRVKKCWLVEAQIKGSANSGQQKWDMFILPEKLGALGGLGGTLYALALTFFIRSYLRIPLRMQLRASSGISITLPPNLFAPF